MTVCRSCGDECGRHAQMHEHCRVCAQACRRCGQACEELLAAMREAYSVAAGVLVTDSSSLSSHSMSAASIGRPK